MFARFEDSAAVLLGMHVFWKCGAVCLSVRPSVWVSISLLFEGTSDFISKSMEFPPEGLNVNAVRSCETLGRSNPATQLHIPDDLFPQYNVHYTGFEGKGFARSSGRAV